MTVRDLCSLLQNLAQDGHALDEVLFVDGRGEQPRYIDYGTVCVYRSGSGEKTCIRLEG